MFRVLMGAAAFAFGAALPTALLVTGSVLAQGRSVNISRSEMGGDWPFTVSGGRLSCTRYGAATAVVFTAGGKSYGVNGVARSRLGLPSPAAIWRDDPAGGKVAIGPVIQKGLKLCG